MNGSQLPITRNLTLAYALSLAITLLGLGLCVFIAILALIVRGHRAHRRGKLG